MPRHDGTAARQLIADMYGCSSGILNDPEIIKNTARRAVEMIGAEIVEESLHRFAPVGITYCRCPRERRAVPEVCLQGLFCQDKNG